MDCPNCQTQLRISRSYNKQVDGRLLTVQELSCVNKKCKYCVAKMPVKVIEHAIPVKDPGNIKYCCGNVLCKTGSGKIEVAPDILRRPNGDKMIVVCPTCKTEYSY